MHYIGNQICTLTLQNGATLNSALYSTQVDQLEHGPVERKWAGLPLEIGHLGHIRLECVSSH